MSDRQPWLCIKVRATTRAVAEHEAPGGEGLLALPAPKPSGAEWCCGLQTKHEQPGRLLIMDHLTTLDAGFLKVEDADRKVSLAIGGLAVIEGPAPDQAALESMFARRMRACPRLGQRLRRRPFDLGAPRWVTDPDFDIGRHVRRVGLPNPGADQELFRLTADIMARRLARDRPLWEIWVIEGLADGRWAVLTKIHHCMADGVAASHMLTGLCDPDFGAVSDSLVRHVRAAAEPERPGLLRALSTVTPLGVLGGLWNASTAIAAGAVSVVQGAAQIAVGMLRPTSSPLNGPIGDLRRYGGARVPLADVEQVCQTFDVTVNDVALAAITESFRNMLVGRGELPRADSLRTLVPVSVRSTDAFGVTDNRVSLMLPYLPVDEENPVKRLRAVHARLGRTKAGASARPEKRSCRLLAVFRSRWLAGPSDCSHGFLSMVS